MDEENRLNDIIIWKNYRSEDLKRMDFLELVDVILCKESEGKSNKWKNTRWVELKTMNIDDLIELQLNYEILKMTPNSIRDEIYNYKIKEERRNKVKDNSKVKVVNYEFNDDELLFWNPEDDYPESESIDLEELIDWDEIYELAIEKMKEQFPKETKFVKVEDEDPEEDDDI